MEERVEEEPFEPREQWHEESGEESWKNDYEYCQERI
ncbi:hypothetical protein A2U01_0086366, partial [Trifolium medium]|nr:hypothetical protein [Trifolium medium]